jgi:hypothetical protein
MAVNLDEWNRDLQEILSDLHGADVLSQQGAARAVFFASKLFSKKFPAGIKRQLPVKNPTC